MRTIEWHDHTNKGLAEAVAKIDHTRAKHNRLRRALVAYDVRGRCAATVIAACFGVLFQLQLGSVVATISSLLNLVLIYVLVVGVLLLLNYVGYRWTIARLLHGKWGYAVLASTTAEAQQLRQAFRRQAGEHDIDLKLEDVIALGDEQIEKALHMYLQDTIEPRAILRRRRIDNASRRNAEEEVYVASIAAATNIIEWLLAPVEISH